jgi:hypothetical protein
MNMRSKIPGTNLKPAPQLDPKQIELRLKRGAALLRCENDEEYKELLDTYQLNSGAPSDYQNAARMYWMTDRFDKKLVTLLPWSVMLELSRPTKPLDVREMLSDLCIWWTEARSMENVPSQYYFPTEKSLVLAVVDHPDIYRGDLAILHAKAKIERGLPYTEEEYALSESPTPDLISRVRNDRNIVVSKAVDKAIAEIAAATNNGFVKLNGAIQIEESQKVQAALTEIQALISDFKNDDNQVIITSLRNHANGLERQLTNALQVNEDLQNENEALRGELARRDDVDAENRALRDQLEDLRAGIMMLVERFGGTSQQVMVIDKEKIVEAANA